MKKPLWASYTNHIAKVTQYAYHAAGWKTNEVIVGTATNKYTAMRQARRLLRAGRNQLTSWGYDLYGRVVFECDGEWVAVICAAKAGISS